MNTQSSMRSHSVFVCVCEVLFEVMDCSRADVLELKIDDFGIRAVSFTYLSWLSVLMPSL
jgi:hypothetical protein